MPLQDETMRMASGMANRAGGASPGGLQPPMGMPPPPATGQLPLGGTPQQSQGSQVAPLLEQVKQIVVQGNEADLAALGEFMQWLNQLVQEHDTGLAGGMGTPAPGTTPPMAPR